MKGEDLEVKIAEDYIILKNKNNGKKTILNEDELKEMIISYFQLIDDLDFFRVELNKLRKL